MFRNILRWTIGLPVFLLFAVVLVIGLFFFWLFGIADDKAEAKNNLKELFDSYLYG